MVQEDQPSNYNSRHPRRRGDVLPAAVPAWLGLCAARRNRVGELSAFWVIRGHLWPWPWGTGLRGQPQLLVGRGGAGMAGARFRALVFVRR